MVLVTKPSPSGQDQDQQQQAKPQADAAFPEAPGAEEEQQGKEQGVALKTGISQSKNGLLNDWLIKRNRLVSSVCSQCIGCQCSGKRENWKTECAWFSSPSDGRGVSGEGMSWSSSFSLLGCKKGAAKGREKSFRGWTAFVQPGRLNWLA